MAGPPIGQPSGMSISPPRSGCCARRPPAGAIFLQKTCAATAASHSASLRRKGFTNMQGGAARARQLTDAGLSRRGVRCSCLPQWQRRTRNRAPIVRAVTTRDLRCRRAIRRCVPRAAIVMRAAGPGRFPIRGPMRRAASRRDLLAEERGAAAGGKLLLRDRRQGRRPGRNCVPVRSRTRSTAPAATIATSTSRPIRRRMLASRPARPTIAAGPGPTRGRVISDRRRAAISRTR